MRATPNETCTPPPRRAERPSLRDEVKPRCLARDCTAAPQDDIFCPAHRDLFRAGKLYMRRIGATSLIEAVPVPGPRVFTVARLGKPAAVVVGIALIAAIWRIGAGGVDGELPVAAAETRAASSVELVSLAPGSAAPEVEPFRPERPVTRETEHQDVEALIRQLNDPSPVLRRGAAARLRAEWSRAAIVALTWTLIDRDPTVREEAQHTLRSIVARGAAEDIVDVIESHFNSAGIGGRSLLVLALGSIARERAVRLLSLLASCREDPFTRLAAIQGLGRTDADDALAELTTLLDDQDAGVRAEACLALGHLRDVRSFEDLLHRLSDPDHHVVEAAGWALERITRQRLGPDAARWRAWWESGMASCEAAFVAYADAPASARPGLLAAMSLVRDRRAIAFAREEIWARSTEERLAAIRALGAMGAMEAVPDVAELLLEQDPVVARGAQDALVAITGNTLPASRGAWLDWWNAVGEWRN